MSDRRSFLKRSAGFLAVAAVGGLPKLAPAVVPPAPAAAPEPRSRRAPPATVGFPVFGRTTIYAVPGRPEVP